MSTSHSKTIEYEGDYYPPEMKSYDPERRKYKARFSFHHTSDTVSWERADPDAPEVFKDRLLMSGEEYDALHEAVMDGSTELKQFRAGVEAVLGTMERNSKRAEAALREAMKGSDQKFIDHCSARCHEANRMLSNVRYAFADAGLPVAKVRGEPKLLK